MEQGIKNQIELKVDAEKTAKMVGSGTLDVFATPAMIALMEQTAAESVENELDEGMTTVGIKINVEHLAATPIGMKVICNSNLVQIDGRKLVFEIEASDEAGVIGKAYHERFIVDSKRFMDKTLEKLKK